MLLFSGSVTAVVDVIINGGFESGNTGFTSSYAYVPPQQSNCFNEETYSISGNANDCHGSWDNVGPRTGSLFFYTNGGPNAGVSVWNQTFIGVPGATY